MYALALQQVLLEIIFDLFYFPIWWYTFGMFRAARWSAGVFKEGNDLLAPGIWLRNIFVPMFGQYDWQGRIISFFMRMIQIIFRSAALIVWLFVSTCLFVGYVFIPIIIVFGILNNFHW